MGMAKVWRWQYAVAGICLGLALLAGCSQDPNVKKRKLLESGQRYFDKGQYQEAAIQFENAIQVDDRFADAHYKLAQTAMKLEQWNSAYQEFSKTIEIQPDRYAAQLDLANLLIVGRHYGEAKQNLDVLAKNQPSNPDVYLALSSYDSGVSNPTAAVADAQKAIQLDPTRYDLYMNLAVLEMRGEQFDAAEGNFKKAVELNPKSANALVLLGNFYQTRGRFPEAEQTFRRAIAAAANDPHPRLSLAGLYMAENKPGQAEDVLRQSKKDFADNPAGYTMLGDFYYGNNQTDKATDEYAELYRDHPKDSTVKRNYIHLLILKNRLDDARKLNDEILKEKADDEDALIHKGMIEMDSDKGSDAVNTLQGVLKNNPDNAIAHYQLGLAFDHLGNGNRAEAEWRDAVRLRNEMVDAHRALAGVAIQRHDPAGLAQEADQIIALQPGAPDGYLLRGLAEIDRKDFVRADEYLHRSIAVQPDNPDAYVQLGNLRMAENKLEEAQKAFQQALDQSPNFTDALGGVLNVDLAEHQPDRAIATARTQLSKYPKNVGFHIMLGALLVEQKKDLAGGEEQFRQALELDKNSSEARVKLGIVQNQRGAVEEALQTYLEGAKINPKVIPYYLLAGGIYENKRDWDHAKEQYQKALDIQPDNPVASNNLAYVILQQGGNVDVAFAMAQTARRQMPDNPSSADTLGWAFYHKHVYGSAITLFREAVKKEPDNPLFNLHLGLAYAKNGQVALARQQLDRLLRMNPNSADVDQLRQALAEARG
jgi:tetratricopeptide (TPR) repeat protein